MMFTRKEKLFILFASLSAFFTCAEYAITRPASNALFLTIFSSKAYPWVWLATVPLNFLVIYLYNRYLPKIGPLKMVISFAALTIFINASTALLVPFFPKMIFFQYAWKDIYILLMLKQIWSMIHSTISASRAKYLYGCIYGVGTIGSILGSFVPAFLAPILGSEMILTSTIFAYALLLFCYTMAFYRSNVEEANFEKKLSDNPHPKEAISLIRRTPILTAVLLLVVFMQISAGLMEYRFNAHLELNILDQDLRAAYSGRVVSMIGSISLMLQFIGGFILIKTLGLRKSHFLVPMILCFSAFFSMMIPTFAVLSICYTLFKAIDFSLFGVIREMLYVPLELDAKFRAKAIIDVFAYRTSKAFVSVALLSLQLIVGSAMLQTVGYLSILVFIGWLITVAILFRKAKELKTI